MSIDDLVLSLQRGGRIVDPGYAAKMLHPIPTTTVVNREQSIISAVKGKVILDIGCSGPLHKAIEKVAKKSFGIDIVDVDCDNFNLCNIETDPFPEINDVQLIICGEVIEHLSNPGIVLEKLKKYDCPILFTVPNAFSEVGALHIKRGIENVNPEHVAYYSHKTFTTLLSRHGYAVNSFWWYGGKPLVSEGMIFLAKATGVKT